MSEENAAFDIDDVSTWMRRTVDNVEYLCVPADYIEEKTDGENRCNYCAFVDDSGRCIKVPCFGREQDANDPGYRTSYMKVEDFAMFRLTGKSPYVS